jgi:hypothetical protein
MSGCNRRPASGDDAGVIAIVVALSVSTFVLGFAALAVDLGSAYVRKAEMQSVANRLALAGAKGLPTVLQVGGAVTQIDAALTGICRTDALPGVCTVAADGTGSAPDPAWMTDGDPANGEVTFYVDPDGDAKYGLADRITDLARTGVATALQVKLAPSRVEFGLAGAIGTDSAAVTRSARGASSEWSLSGLPGVTRTQRASSRNRRSVSSITRTWPAWMGLKLPPNRPMRMPDADGGRPVMPGMRRDDRRVTLRVAIVRCRGRDI